MGHGVGGWGMAATASSPPNPKLDELVEVLAQLRAPGGCAWDADQTHESLVRYLTEETHELIDAIETGTRDDLIEELGDVLYQVIFHSDIAAHTPSENFTLEDVASHMTAKMIARHPHVFGDAEAKAAMGIRTADDVMAVWDDLKATEKPHRTSVLDGIPQGMPALALADKLVGRAEKVGVQIPRGAAASTTPHGSPPTGTEAELGAQLLAIVAAARTLGLDPERALRSTLRELQNDIRSAEATPSRNPRG